LPTENENLILWQIEEEIFNILQEEVRGFVSLIITTKGMREFVIYSKENKYEDIIEKLKSTFLKYDFQSYIEEDPDWLGYRYFSELH